MRGRVEFSRAARTTRGEAPLAVIPTVPGRPPPPYRSDDPDGRVGPDGGFALEGLLGTRCLLMWDIREGWRLGAILRDGRDITDEPITFATGQQVDDVILRLVPGDGRSDVPRAIHADARDAAA